jgi:N-methylhydantoinase B
MIELDTPGKATGYPVRRSEVVIMRAAGGGGYGDPLQRDPELVRSDVLGGYVSETRARDGYGVLLHADTTVDFAGTERLRRELQSKRFRFSVVADDTVDAYAGDKGRRRVLALATPDMAALGAQIDDLVEMLGRHPAPLRAWLAAGPAVAGEVRLDEFARRALGVNDGDRVEIRLLPTPVLPKGLAP